MVSRLTDCDPNRLRRLLEDRLDDLDQTAMAEHLETCAECRRTLDAMAAGSRWWSEARMYLNPEPTCDLSETPQGRKAEIEPGLLDFLASSDDPAHLGRLGPYEVVEVIGRGGMGLVLRAIDPALNRHVAIKVLAPGLATSATARRRFAREGQAAAAISHDHIVAIHSVDGSGGLPYLVMQLVTGKSLQERIDQTGPLAIEEILRIGMQTASGLAAAHAVGLIHRDIKPSNILLENCVERVKITDFGLARAVDDASLTQSGVVAGTPQYMSPEQARGEAADHRSDLFSLGSVLYALCTGRAPFRADTTMAVLRRVSDDTPRAIRELNADVPAWLAAIVTRLHAKNPADRYQSATEVMELLSRCLAYLREPTLVPCPFPTEPTPMRKPRRKLALAGGIAALALCALGAAEATGVTKFVATVMRFKTADGMLVVKVSDPKVKVKLDGKDLVITGAGPEEIRVNAGDHRVQGFKDGKVVSEKIVTIGRGGEETVEVSVEGTTPNPGEDPWTAALKPVFERQEAEMKRKVQSEMDAANRALDKAKREAERDDREAKKGSDNKNANQDRLAHQSEIAQAQAELKRASERLDWAKKMFEKGYVSQSQFDSDHFAFEKSKIDSERASRDAKSDAVRVTKKGKVADPIAKENEVLKRKIDQLQSQLNLKVQNAQTPQEALQGYLKGLTRLDGRSVSPDSQPKTTVDLSSVHAQQAIVEGIHSQQAIVQRIYALERLLQGLSESDGPERTKAIQAVIEKLKQKQNDVRQRMVRNPNDPALAAITTKIKDLEGEKRLLEEREVHKNMIEKLKSELERLRNELVRKPRYRTNGGAAADIDLEPRVEKAGEENRRLDQPTPSPLPDRRPTPPAVRRGNESRQGGPRLAPPTPESYQPTPTPVESLRPVSPATPVTPVEPVAPVEPSLPPQPTPTPGPQGSAPLPVPAPTPALAPQGLPAIAPAPQPTPTPIAFSINSREVGRAGIKISATLSPTPTPSPTPQPTPAPRISGAGLFQGEAEEIAAEEQVGTAVLQVVLAPDGKTFATACDDGVIRIYDLDTQKVVRELKAPVVSTMEEVRETIEGKEISRMVRNETKVGRLWALAYRLDGNTLVSAGGDYADHEHPSVITVWDVPSGKVKARLKGHEQTIFTLAISPDGRRLVSGGFDKSIRIWDLMHNTLIYTVDGHVDPEKGVASPVRSIAWNPDGESFASAGFDGALKIWAKNGQAIETVKLPEKAEGDEIGLNSVVYARDGKNLVVGGGTRAHVLAWKDGKAQLLKSFDFPQQRLLSVAISPDGKSIAAGGGDYENCLILKTWEIDSGNETRTVIEPSEWIESLVYTPDGKTLIAGGGVSHKSGFITLWDLVSKRQAQTPTVNPRND